MTLREHQSAFMRDVNRLLSFLLEKGYEVTGGELERTKYQQQEYLRTGASKTMLSKHLKRCAIDLHIFLNGALLQKKEDLQEVGDYWESLDPLNEWGGNWKSFYDGPHFQRTV